MEINIAQIFEGWRNKLIPPKKLKDNINTVSKYRMEICRQCPHNSVNSMKGGMERCLLCGCPLSAKTKCLSCTCPMTPAKWGPILNKEDEDNLKTQINGQQSST